jgi:hypothetical protein
MVGNSAGGKASDHFLHGFELLQALPSTGQRRALGRVLLWACDGGSLVRTCLRREPIPSPPKYTVFDGPRPEGGLEGFTKGFTGN